MEVLRQLLFSGVATAIPQVLHTIVVRLEALLLRDELVSGSCSRDQGSLGAAELETRLAAIPFGELTRERMVSAHSDAAKIARQFRPQARGNHPQQQPHQGNQNARQAGNKRKGFHAPPPEAPLALTGFLGPHAGGAPDPEAGANPLSRGFVVSERRDNSFSGVVLPSVLAERDAVSGGESGSVPSAGSARDPYPCTPKWLF